MSYQQNLPQKPRTLYPFSNNGEHYDLGGPAVQLRGELNAVGVRIKRRPRLEQENFWTAEIIEINCRLLDERPTLVRQPLAASGTVVIYKSCLGTSLTWLAERASKPYACSQAALIFPA